MRRGVGVVARNSDGHIAFSACKYYGRCGSAPEEAALACTKDYGGLSSGNCLGSSSTTDYARIVEAMRSTQKDRSGISFVIEEAKGLTRLLNEWRIPRVKREGNNVGNALASLARHSKMSKAWLEKTPPGVEA